MRLAIITLAAAMVLATSAQAMTITNFYAVLGSENVIKDGAPASSESAVGIANFTLTEFAGDPGATTLSYHIELNFLDLDGSQTGSAGDNVTAIHFHDLNFLASGAPNLIGDTAGTKHVLNIFGIPRQDDADMTFDAPAGTVSGLWDDGDQNLAFPPSESISDVLGELKNGELFVMIHNNTFPGGAIGGAIVPEPSTWMLAIVSAALFIAIAGRRMLKNSCRVDGRSI